MISVPAILDRSSLKMIFNIFWPWYYCFAKINHLMSKLYLNKVENNMVCMDRPCHFIHRSAYNSVNLVELRFFWQLISDGEIVVWLVKSMNPKRWYTTRFFFVPYKEPKHFRGRRHYGYQESSHVAFKKGMSFSLFLTDNLNTFVEGDIVNLRNFPSLNL